MARVAADCLDDILEAAKALNPGDSLSPRVLRAIAEHAAGRDIRRSVETGAGGSTLLFSHLSAGHIAFTVEDDNSIITRVKSSLVFRAETTSFVEGPTQRTLPHYIFEQPLDAVLIDGPHAFPFPQLEYFYLYPHLGTGALLIVDDIHIRTIHEFCRFLRKDSMFELLEIVERTAFFRRTGAPVFDPWSDGWWLQSYNRRPLSRYIWTEVLRKSLPRPLRGFLRGTRSLWRNGIATAVRRSVRIEEPWNGSTVGAQAVIRGRADLPAHAALWIFARRADLEGWWPQGGGPATVSDGRWERPCKFGEACDTGHPFDVAAVALDEQKHRAVLRCPSRPGRGDGILCLCRNP